MPLDVSPAPEAKAEPDPAKDKAGDANCTMLSIALELRFVPATLGGSTTISRPGDRCGNVTLPTCD